MGLDGSQAKTLVGVVMVLGRLAHHDTYGRCLQPVGAQHKRLRVPLAATRAARPPMSAYATEEQAIGRLSQAVPHRQPSSKPQRAMLAGARRCLTNSGTHLCTPCHDCGPARARGLLRDTLPAANLYLNARHPNPIMCKASRPHTSALRVVFIRLVAQRSHTLLGCTK